MADPFLGEIMPVAFNYAPVGYALCNGALVNVAANNALYALLANNYGGTSPNTFGLPNLQGRFIMGAGTTPNTSNNYPQASVGGAASVNCSFQGVGLLNANNIPKIPITGTPTLTATTTINALAGPTTRVVPPTGNLLTAGFDTGSNAAVQNYAPPTTGNGTAVTLAPGAATTAVTGTIAGTVGAANPAPFSATCSGSVATMPPYQSILYIIAMQGLWPTRN